MMPVLATGVGLLDVVLTLLYLGVCAYLGWLGYRRTRNAADYLLAGRKVHPFVMAMSYGATFISTSAIVGFGGVAAMFGMSLLWLTFLNIFIGIFIAFILLGGPTRRMGHRLDAHTFPEFLGRRYNSKAVHVLAGLVIFLFMPIYAAAVLMGGTEFLQQAFNLDYGLALLVFGAVTAIYVFFGGLKGVLYTDAFQGTIMTVGMLFLLVATYALVGGVRQGHADLTAMKDQVFVGFKAIGHQGWTAMPKFGWGKPAGLPAAAPSPYDLWWTVIGTIVMGVGIGVLAQPQLIVRFLTVKSGRELNRALAIGGTFILMMTGVAFTVGALCNVYFFKHEKIVGKILNVTDRADVIVKREPGVADKTIPCKLLHLDTFGDGREDTVVIAQGLGPAEKIMPKATVAELPDGKVEVTPHATGFTRAVVWDAGLKAWMLNGDSIIPIFVTSAMPAWFKTVFMLTLLSAAMSTMSSQYHTLGAAMGRDVFEPLFGGGSSSNRTLHIVRLGIVVGLILAAIIAYRTRGGFFIARATSIFFGLCASTFLPAFVGGLFSKRITKPAVIASMIVGFLTTAFWVVLVKSAEAGSIGLVRMITGGKNSILADYPNWPVVDPILVALPLSALTVLVVSLLTRPPAEAHLTKCFGGAAAPAEAGRTRQSRSVAR
jgi:SSS family solute:Na+ symporter